MPKKWAALDQEIEALRRTLLPNPFNPIGVYKHQARVQTETRAFLVLSHAEIETFLEDWAKDIARAAEIVWSRQQRVTTPLAFLIANVADRVKETNSLAAGSAKDSQQRFADIVSEIFPAYYKRIKDNNGVKERNVLRLFDPIGVAGSAFGSTLLPALNSFGSARGEHAHYSRKAVTSVLDPLSEYNRVRSILTELKSLDQWLSKYRRRVR